MISRAWCMVLVLVFAACLISLLPAPALGASAMHSEKYDSGEPDFARQ